MSPPRPLGIVQTTSKHRMTMAAYLAAQALAALHQSLLSSSAASSRASSLYACASLLQSERVRLWPRWQPMECACHDHKCEYHDDSEFQKIPHRTAQKVFELHMWREFHNTQPQRQSLSPGREGQRAISRSVGIKNDCVIATRLV